jgi:hypothetical protein
MNKEIVIVDHIARLTQTESNTRLIKDLTIMMKNVRKYRGKIERRKSKIKKLYE